MTGAARGIDTATAKLFVEEGVHAAITEGLAELIAFLASGSLAYRTGATFAANGGWTAS